MVHACYSITTIPVFSRISFILQGFQFVCLCNFGFIFVSPFVMELCYLLCRFLFLELCCHFSNRQCIILLFTTKTFSHEIFLWLSTYLHGYLIFSLKSPQKKLVDYKLVETESTSLFFAVLLRLSHKRYVWPIGFSFLQIATNHFVSIYFHDCYRS